MAAKWRGTREYRRWRGDVLARDGACVSCRAERKLQAHHLEDGSHNPDLRTDVGNGVTLCGKCHTAFHTMYKKSFRERTTQDDFINFMDLFEYVSNTNRRIT